MKIQLIFSAFTESILYAPILEDNIQSFSLSQSYFYSTFCAYCKLFYICGLIEYFQPMTEIAIVAITNNKFFVVFKVFVENNFTLSNYTILSLQKVDAFT